MTRLVKILGGVGMASVYLLQVGPCQFAGHGFSIIPNGIIPNPLTGLIQSVLGPLGLA